MSASLTANQPAAVAGVLARPDVTLHYWTSGPAGAAWVVLTHGASLDHHTWDALVPAFAARVQVLTWDVRGHGASRPAAFSLPAAEADLLALLDHVGAAQAVFIGHSMGGNLHQELAFHHPQRVRGLACLGCTWNFQALGWLDRLTLRLAGPLLQLYPYNLLLTQAAAGTVTAPAGRAQLRQTMARHSQAEFIEILLATTRCLHPEPDYHLGRPLLLIMGALDQTGNIRQAMPAWARHEPGSQLVVIPGARHAVHLDAPAAVQAALLTFLDQFRPD